jgi:hypothetical protein
MLNNEIEKNKLKKDPRKWPESTQVNLPNSW